MANKKIITITVRNKIADGCGTELVCDNSDYRIRFDLDSDWDGINAKTARLLFGTGHYDFPFTGNEVDIDVPIPAVRSVTIGVFAGDIKTSTPAFFKCRPSVKSSQSTPTPPPPEDVYNKIMELIEGVDDAILEVDELPSEGIDPSTFYNVGGKLYYRVGDKWAEITTDFFDYVKRGEYDAAMQSLTDSLAEINEGVDGKLTAMGESLKETDDKAVIAHNKAVEVNQLANNALSISSVALQGNQDEVKRATEVERILGEKIDNVESIAKGANRAVSYGNYQTMVMALNALSIDSLTIGQNIMIVTLNVPDLWVAEKVETSTIYNYTTDEQFVETLKNAGFVQVGHFKLSALETQKVDIDGYPTTEELNEALSAYVKSTDYATEEKAGVVKVGSTTTDPLYADDNGDLHLGNDNALIDQRSGENAIRNQDLDHAIKVGLVGNQLLLTEDDKKKIIAWLGLEAGNGQLGFAQYAYEGGAYGSTPFPGIVSYSQTFGITAFNNALWRNTLAIAGATPAVIDKKSDLYRPITVHYLDYAVFKALTDPKENSNFPTFWDADSRKLAQKTLGVGEWIDKIQTNEEGTQFSLSASGEGVYEYVLYVLSSMGTLHAYDSQTLVIGIDGLPDSTLVEKHIDLGNGVATNAFIYRGQFKIDLFITPDEVQGFPSTVVFKARKIREI